MKVFQIIVDFITSFTITSGGALGIALLVAKGVPLSFEAWAAIVALGLVQGAKSTRNLVGLPPLSNGNYEAIAELVKARKGDTSVITKPKDQ